MNFEVADGSNILNFFLAASFSEIQNVNMLFELNQNMDSIIYPLNSEK